MSAAVAVKCFKGLSWDKAKRSYPAVSHQGRPRPWRCWLALSSEEGPGLDFWGNLTFFLWPLREENFFLPLSKTREAKFHCSLSLEFWQERVFGKHLTSLPCGVIEPGNRSTIGQNHTVTHDVRENPKNPAAQMWTWLHMLQCSCGFFLWEIEPYLMAK